MIEEFRIDVPQAELDELRDRLAHARWPRTLPGVGWDRGVPPEYLRHVVQYWLDSYDWRDWEARLNSYPQYTTIIDDQRIHFLHVRSPEAGALPLILTHGWPGSVAEFLDVLGPLTDPRSYGADPADAFHIVAPSVPGHGFSVPLEQPGWNHMRIAYAWAELMRLLGYEQYGAQGGDTGSVVSPLLGRIAPDHVIGVHINGGLAFPDGDLGTLGPRDRAKLEFAEYIRATGTGYAELQSTKPQTVSYALADSPVGQLAWILEKFHDWTDPAKSLPEEAVALDHILTDVCLYWFANTSSTSANLYYENRRRPQPQPTPTSGAGPSSAAASLLGRSTVPTGVAVFPTDPAMRHVLERDHTITHWTEFDRGGHFAALEAPDLLVGDIRTFFRPLRRGPQQ